MYDVGICASFGCVENAVSQFPCAKQALKIFKVDFIKLYYAEKSAVTHRVCCLIQLKFEHLLNILCNI